MDVWHAPQRQQRVGDGVRESLRVITEDVKGQRWGHPDFDASPAPRRTGVGDCHDMHGHVGVRLQHRDEHASMEPVEGDAIR